MHLAFSKSIFKLKKNLWHLHALGVVGKQDHERVIMANGEKVREFVRSVGREKCGSERVCAKLRKML